jgi:hypothetical protein
MRFISQNVKFGDQAVVNLSRMYSDRVNLVKADGRVVREDLLAVVMKGKIQLHDGTSTD